MTEKHVETGQLRAAAVPTTIPESPEAWSPTSDKNDTRMRRIFEDRTKNSKDDNNRPRSVSEGQPREDKDHVDHSVLRTIRKKLSQTFRHKKKPKQPTAGYPIVRESVVFDVTVDFPEPSPSFRSRIDSYTDAFLTYSPKDKSRPWGMGALVIVPLFTNELVGYRQDIKSIEDYFQRIEYKIFKTKVNCNRETLLVELERIQGEIQSSEIDFDRLICFVLSHGDKDGILTCKDVSGQEEEKETVTKAIINDEDEAVKVEVVQPKITTIDEIVTFFKHEDHQLPKLKGMPKLFIVQACRGNPAAKSAGPYHRSYSIEEDAIDGPKPFDDPEIALHLQPCIPVDADIEICYASTPEHYAFVHDSRGSWLVQDILRVFSKHSSDRSVSEMLTTVRFSVAERRHRFNFGEAIQQPCVASTFRKQFWLHHNVIKESTSVTQNDTESECSYSLRQAPYSAPYFTAGTSMFTFDSLPQSMRFSQDVPGEDLRRACKDLECFKCRVEYPKTCDVCKNKAEGLPHIDSETEEMMSANNTTLTNVEAHANS